MNVSTLFLSACALLAAVAPAKADLIDQVNAIRRAGCEGRAGAAPLKQTKGMDAIASEWAKGGRLRDAVERAQYRVVNSASMRVSGVRSDAEARDILAKNYCENVLNKDFTEIGAVRKGGEVWIVLAKPFAETPMQNIDVIRRRALALVNEARAKPRKCGATAFGPAPPLQNSVLLDQAAQIHATDMAMHNFFAHEGSDGSRPSDRITRVGYKWRAVAENIAAGYREIDPVVAGWIQSPGHCANLMNPVYTQMGIAFALNPKSESGVYWSQTFGRPR
ncbi:MAG TPA: CAP domain-containing protein [Steroidobacteraceae bacterium]|nr:CAP domain-containing protein [Steroidobacteraceae bacterium]